MGSTSSADFANDYTAQPAANDYNKMKLLPPHEFLTGGARQGVQLIWEEQDKKADELQFAECTIYGFQGARRPG
jgi:hypothetical protein